MPDEKLKRAIDVVFLGSSGYYNGEFVSRISGKKIMVKASFTPVLNDDGSLLGGIGIIEDIEKRQKAENLINLNEMRLEALLKLYQMQDCQMHEIAEYTIQKGVELTSSKIGYLEFLNEEEKVLETYQWPKDIYERSKKEPFVHPVRFNGFWGEAIRERRAIIVNRADDHKHLDDAYPQKIEKTLRHITVPVFDNEQIVAVAGVLNKDTDYDESDVRQLTLLMEGMWKLVQYKNTNDVIYEALRMRRLLESIMSSSPAIVFLWKPEHDWPVDFVSDNIEQFGYQVDDFISGKIIYGDIIHPSDLQRVRDEVERATIEGFSDFSQEYRILTSSGEVRWVDERTKLHYDDVGMLSYLQGIIVDITESKHASNFMRIGSNLDNIIEDTGDIRDTLKKMLDFALEARTIDCGVIYSVDQKTGDFDAAVYKGFSEKFVTSLSHFSSNTLLARFFTTGYPVYKYFSEISKMLGSFRLEDEGLQAMAFIPVRFNDQLIAALLLASNKELEIPADSRNLVETIANQLGVIISRKSSYPVSHKNKNNLISIVDILDEMVFIISMEGEILYVNPPLIKNLGYNEKELLNKDFLILYPPGQEDNVLSELDNIMDGSSDTCDIPLISKEGYPLSVRSKFTFGDWDEQDVLVVICAFTRSLGFEDTDQQ